MRSRKRVMIWFGLLTLVLAVLLHFVPVYSKSGFIDHASTGGASTCIGYPNKVPHNYRLILDGLSGFQKDKRALVDDVFDARCGIEPVSLRLYVL